MAVNIAILEDEPDIAELVSLHLKKAGFQTAVFHNAEGLTLHLKRHDPDLLILDLMLPDADGMEVCKSLRRDPKTAAIPIIIVTAKGEETDRVLGLELGADDYVTKPFSPRELVARAKAVLRRKRIPEAPVVLEAGGIRIDEGQHQVTVSGRVVALTATEFRLLALLASRPGWVFSRDRLLDHLWSNEKAVVDRTVDVHIKNLREKLGKAGQAIKNVRGVGYKLEP
jgi:two-component system phosphate regulon response regulator PhoB/two-component system alkaline phosphatase synthesis response regulator PhoP